MSSVAVSYRGLTRNFGLTRAPGPEADWSSRLVDSSGSSRADVPGLSMAIPPSNLNALDFVSTSLSLSSLYPELCALKSRSPTPTKIKMPAVNLAKCERLEIMTKEGYRLIFDTSNEHWVINGVHLKHI